MAPTETTPITPTEEGTKLRFDSSLRSKEALWGIPLTALLMSCFILGLFYAYLKVRILPGFWDPYGLGSLNLLFAGTALGGSIGLRVLRLSWRQVVLASLLAGAILLIFARLRPSYTFPGDLFTLIFVAGGVFFLPLLDPAVRRNGPAPSPWKVALAAFILSILVIRSTVLNSPLGAFIPFLLSMGIVLGLLLSLSKKEKNLSDGALVGELSVLLTLFLMAILLSGLRV